MRDYELTSTDDLEPVDKQGNIRSETHPVTTREEDGDWAGNIRFNPALAVQSASAAIRRSGVSGLSNASGCVLQLQRQYGNHFVQRMFDSAKSEDGEQQAAPEVQSSIERNRGTGQALEERSRAEMESALGSDFSDVRVHTDTEADGLNRAVNAVAFTSGRDVFFRQGAYQPRHSAGRAVLAHELTHVVQQRGSTNTIQRLTQDLPYVGAAAAYLNPLNQAARLVLPALSPAQKTLLDGIFGASLATSIIRLNQNSILGAGSCYRTTGNIINMPGTTIDDDHLIHEAAHVWQHQNTIFGVGYAVSALKAMAIAQVFGGDWEKAYNYTEVEKYHIPWRYWNAEQQAHWIQDHRRLPSGWMLDGVLPDFPPSTPVPGLPPKMDPIESTGL
jgi:hypothetical protein